MRLKSIEYSEYKGQENEWTLDKLSLGAVNLVVGKNASGKTRILNVVRNTARGLTRGKPFENGDTLLVFDDNGTEIRYETKIVQGHVQTETFTVDEALRLDRSTDGKGEIYAEVEDRLVAFQTPDEQLAAVSRRDNVQHPFFEPLHDWANSLYYYSFGTHFGKNQVAVFVDQPKGRASEFDAKDPDQLASIFRKGKIDFPDKFTPEIIRDFGLVGYRITEVGLGAPPEMVLAVPGQVAAVYVREADLSTNTFQTTMSQGMFRALSIIVQVNYAVLAGSPSCIIIDDIGEGLDFDRSRRLIEVLIARAKESNVQLIMATNDRYVMNHIPLQHWSVVDRKGGQVRIRNAENSKELFESFSHTGLSNFDFLAFDYINSGTPDE